MLEGEQVTVDDMMICRDRRFQTQQYLLAKYDQPLLSFALNIPGPVKTNSQLHACFSHGVSLIEDALKTNQISVLERIVFDDKTGDELILSFDGGAALVKKVMTDIEEANEIGRLYDIDIIDVTGEKLSRPVFRKCLICDCQAQECARARIHSVEEMQNKIIDILKEAGF